MGRTSIGTGNLSSRRAECGHQAVRDRNIENGSRLLLNALWREHPRILIQLKAEKPDAD